MKTDVFLREVTALPGPSGNEEPVAQYIKEQFTPYVDDIYVDGLNNVYAHKKGNGPKVIICAHLDEIGCMVEKIEDDGCLRFAYVGGVDSRVMPGMRVSVIGKEKLLGVVGAKPPHILTAQDRKKNYQREEMFVDLGLPTQKVKELVKVGDPICFQAVFNTLLNDRLVTKTADDRACVAIMYRTAQLLQKMQHDADITFVATCQEEIGCYGAMMAGFAKDPDYAIAFDVTHAHTPGVDKGKTSDLDSLVAEKGPFIHPMLRRKVDEVAKIHNITLQESISPDETGTDTDTVNFARAGIPSILFSLPLKYMHTNVEMINMHAMEEGARLLANYLCAIDDTWEGELWN